MRPGAHVFLGEEWWEAKMQYLYIALFVLHWLGPWVLGRHVGEAGSRQCGEGSCSADRGNRGTAKEVIA